MAGQGNGQEGGAGIVDIAAALAPLAAIAAPRGGGQNITYTLALLQRAAEARREQERDAAASASTARIMADMGLTTDPTMPANQQVSLGNTQIAMGTAKRQAEKDALAAKDAARSRDVFGKLADIRSRVGAELPEDLTARLQTLAPDAGRSAEVNQGFDKALADIRESDKRLTTARSVSRPFETATTYPAIEGLPTLSLEPKSPYSLGVDTTAPSIPPMSLTTVPDNVHALQRHVMQTGESPDAKTASGFARMFDVPLPSLPGGQEAHRNLVTPKHQFTKFAEDAKGAVTPITVTDDPVTGRPTTTVGAPVQGVGTPQKPERPQAHEVLQSLAFVIAGQTDNPAVLKEHRGLTSDQAQRVRNVIGQAEQQVSPQLSASVLSLQIEELDEALKRIDAKINAAKSDRDKLALETQRATLDAERRAMRSALMRYATPGPLGKDAGTPPPGGATQIDTQRLRDAGVLKN